MSESVTKPRKVSEMRQQCIENDEKSYNLLRRNIVKWLNDEVFQAVEMGVSDYECSSSFNRLRNGKVYKIDSSRITEMTKNILKEMEIDDAVISIPCPVEESVTITITIRIRI